MTDVVGTHELTSSTDDTRAAWLAWRREGIGASEIAAVVGLSPWQSPLALYLRKIGELPDTEPNTAMQLGNDLEPFVADQFHKRTGLHVTGEQTWCVHPELSFARCTVDGFVVESPSSLVSDALGVFEAKTTGNLDRFDPLPTHVELQVQWQMFVTDQQHAWVTAFGATQGGLDVRVIEVVRDETAIQRVLPIVTEFWQRVLDRVPPPVKAYHPSDARDLAAAFDEPEPESSVELDDVSDMIDELRLRKAEAKQLEASIGQIENALKARLGDAEAGTLDGEPVVTWKPVTSTRFDSKACKAQAPDVFERFATQTTSRRFLLRT